MIIGLVGYARSGKDTVADYLVQNHGFVRSAFADPMREALLKLDPRINVGEMLGVSLKEAVANLGWDNLKTYSPDVRHLLQRMGTEVGREMFGENIWVDKAMEIIKITENVVFSDVRYHNEADAILGAGGILWRITRPNVGPVNSHGSELLMDSYPQHKFSSHLFNSKNIDYLQDIINRNISEVKGS